ncbi:MAG TPA: 3-hydroxyacyl-CoA dehydrogenase family protein, partial [Mycobacterium sp.]|nr:3-hydroxyacyl-CoA dehydrogenase family protein [Mycobacterium sp.]
QSGYPTGPLALLDEVSMILARRIREAGRAAAKEEGIDFPEHPSFAVIDTMVVDKERGGRAAGAGFYEYLDGKRVGLWTGLAETFGGDKQIPFNDMAERMLFAEAIESVKCMDENVLRSVADAPAGARLRIRLSDGAVGATSSGPTDGVP